MKTRKPAQARPAPSRPGALSSVRIIGGAWRSRRVRFPDAPGLRPTPDRVRETLFNWLQPVLPGTRCLDLFAGSGVLGLEALSRGAREAVFVEALNEPARMLAGELVRLCGEPGAHRPAAPRGRVIQTFAERFLAAPGEPFDILFLDPPFDLDALPDCVRRIDEGGWVKDGGWVYLENPRAAGAPLLPARWDLVKSKFAGEVGYHLARANARIGP